MNPDFKDLFSALNAAEARFIVIDAHAVIFHSVPRYTKDIDIWIDVSPENALRAYRALGEFGAPMAQLEVKDLEAAGTVFQIGVEPNRVDILTAVSGLSFETAWARRVSSTYGGEPISILAMDDLIASKKAAGRPQDLLDVDLLEKAKRRGS